MKEEEEEKRLKIFYDQNEPLKKIKFTRNFEIFEWYYKEWAASGAFPAGTNDPKKNQYLKDVCIHAFDSVYSISDKFKSRCPECVLTPEIRMEYENEEDEFPKLRYFCQKCNKYRVFKDLLHWTWEDKCPNCLLNTQFIKEYKNEDDELPKNKYFCQKCNKYWDFNDLMRLSK